MKEMDPIHSGTGIFYQAIPAVGADGKNIMKLIPVQMVNGQFFKSQKSQPKTYSTSQRAVNINIPSAPVQMAKSSALNPSATKPIVKVQVPLMQTSSNQVGLNLGKPRDVQSVHQQHFNLMTIVPPMATPATNSGNSARLPNQLAVPVKPPVLPRGQCLQIPPTAQVQTVPTSELQPGIKKQIFTKTANPSPASGVPSGVLSSTTSVNLGVTPQDDSALKKLKFLCKMANKPSCGPPLKGSKSHLKLIPKVSQRPNSPIKWAVEEEDSSTTSTLDPIDSSVTSKILQVVAEREITGKPCNTVPKPGPTLDPSDSCVTSGTLRVATMRENAGKHRDVITKPVSASSRGESGQRGVKPLIKCNGKHQLQQQNVNLMAIAQMTTPVANSATTGRHVNQLPVTVNSLALLRGQYLWIPPVAQVQAVPASELPPGIKKQIFTSSASSSPSSGTAVYVSPTTSSKLGVTPQGDSSLDKIKLLCKTLNKTSCGSPSKESKPHLNLIPKVPQRPNSPIKWVIEGEAPALDPVDSSITSEVLRVVAEREIAGKHCNIVAKPVSGLSQGQRQEDNLAMCEGKVFFVEKKCSPPCETGESDSPTAAVDGFKKTTVPSSKKSLDSGVPQKRQGVKFTLLNESDEVIDLCDDDAHDDSSHKAALVHMSAVMQPDEDNVIFVSYVPPKSESSQYLTLKPQTGHVKETNQKDTSSLDSVAEQKRLDGTTATLKRRKEVESSMTPATSWTPLSAPESHEKADSLFRQIFGITSDVKICLQRIDEAPVWSLSAKQKQDIFSPQENDSCSGLINGERVIQQEVSEDSAAPRLHSDIRTLKCSHSKQNTIPVSVSKSKCHLGKISLKGTLCDVETEPGIGFVEPIDDDFLSTDEKGNHLQDTTAQGQTPSCVDLNTNTRRMGRKRKRTMCPCCIPGNQDIAVKSSIEWEEPDQLMTEQRSKKDGRVKAVRKDVKTSGRISCLTVKNKHISKASEDPASDSLSTTSMDSAELKLHEQITRLKELLQEKEAALELMRNSAS